MFPVIGLHKRLRQLVLGRTAEVFLRVCLVQSIIVLDLNELSELDSQVYLQFLSQGSYRLLDKLLPLVELVPKLLDLLELLYVSLIPSIGCLPLNHDLLRKISHDIPLIRICMNPLSLVIQLYYLGLWGYLLVFLSLR